MSALADYLLARYADEHRNAVDVELVQWLDHNPDHLPADQCRAIRIRAEQALCILAQPYAHRPDFDDAWRL